VVTTLKLKKQKLILLLQLQKLILSLLLKLLLLLLLCQLTLLLLIQLLLLLLHTNQNLRLNKKSRLVRDFLFKSCPDSNDKYRSPHCLSSLGGSKHRVCAQAKLPKLPLTQKPTLFA
jgi:hypothetical protein